MNVMLHNGTDEMDWVTHTADLKLVHEGRRLINTWDSKQTECSSFIIQIPVEIYWHRSIAVASGGGYCGGWRWRLGGIGFNDTKLPI